MLLAKSAKLQDGASKAWCPGVLSLFLTKISWQASSPQASPSMAPELHIGLISITNTQRAKGKPLLRLTAGTSVHMFEFGSEADRDAVVDRYTKAKEELSAQAKARDRAAASAMPSTSGAALPGPSSSSAQGHTAALPSKLAWTGPLPTDAQKREIMALDPEIGERYNSLVAAASVLTEDEFWASVMAERAKSATAAVAAGAGSSRAAASGAAGAGKEGGSKLPALAPIPGQPEQKRGLSNAMFHVPVEQDGRSVAMRFTLTTDLIAMVFAEKPHVRRAYVKNVPMNMSEKEFWTRYLKNEMAKEERRKRLQQASSATPGSSDASAVLASSQAGEHARLFAEDENGAHVEDAHTRRVRRKVLKTADPTVNLDADVGDGFSQGFGLLHTASKEPVARGGFRAMAEELARDINRHATVVLGGTRTLEQQQQAQSRAAGSRPTQSADASSRSSTGAAPEPSSASAGAQGAGVAEKLQGEEALDELAAARLHGYGAGLEDLRAPKPVQYEVLRITEPRAYFDRLATTTTATAATAAGTEQPQPQSLAQQACKQEPLSVQPQLGDADMMQIDALLGVPGQPGVSRCLQLLSAVDPNNLPCPPVSSYDAYEALLDVCGLTGDDGDAGGDALAGKPPPGLAQPPDLVLAPQLLSKFRTQVKIVADIARHFWACIPADTPDKLQKADRLASHVDSKLWPELDHAITTANRMGGPQRPYVRQLLTPALRMMEVMLERHKQERSRPSLRTNT